MISKAGSNSPPLSLGVDPATNRPIITNVPYDNNGNPSSYNGTQLFFDAENHILSAVGLTDYQYESQGKRIWKGSFSGGSLVAQEVYFYGVDGQKLGTYSVTPSVSQLVVTTTQTAVFFGGKRVAVNGAAFVPDRLGSNTAGKYFPYGEDRGNPIGNDQVKFATYTRDGATGLDYADQRYYSNQFARFMIPDPARSKAGPQDPGSWNRYAYTRGDPINRFDPFGTCDQSGDTDTSVTVCGGSADLVLYLPFIQAGLGGGDAFTIGNSALAYIAGLTDSIFRHISDEQARALMNDALAKALDALKTYKDCAGLFGTADTRQNGFDPVTFLQHFAQPGGSQYGGITFANFGPLPAAAFTIGAGGTILDPTPVQGGPNQIASIFINTNSSYSGATNWAGGDAIINAETLLHELGHVYNDIFGSGGSAIKADPFGLGSGANDDLILQHCFTNHKSP